MGWEKLHVCRKQYQTKTSWVQVLPGEERGQAEAEHLISSATVSPGYHQGSEHDTCAMSFETAHSHLILTTSTRGFLSKAG